MICKKCNKEIEYTASVCPHCGEKCVETDDFFHEMLSHVMDENTQSSEELDKLKEHLGAFGEVCKLGEPIVHLNVYVDMIIR